MKRCATCNTPLGHMHGNSVYCHKCRAERKYAKSQIASRTRISMTIEQFRELELQSELGRKIQSLNGPAKETVIALLALLLEDNHES